MRRQARSHAVWLFAALLALPGCGASVDIPQSGALVPEARDPNLTAQAALDRGLEAAKRQEWKAAIGYFTAAQERAHLAPAIMFNLGLAHAKAGNELLADVWLRAYLAAMPDAPNAGAVKAEIRRLEAVVEAKARRLFQQAVAAAEQLPLEETNKSLFQDGRADVLKSIAEDQFSVGDALGGETTWQLARRAVSKTRAEGWERWSPKNILRLKAIGVFLAKADDVQGARQILAELSAKLSTHNDRVTREVLEKAIEDVFWEIFDAELRANNPRGARMIFDQLRDFSQKLKSSHLSLAYLDSGDAVSAEAFARKASAADQYVYGYLAHRAIRQGNISEARKYARHAVALKREASMIGEAATFYARIIAGADPNKVMDDLAGTRITRGFEKSAHNEEALFEMTKILLILGDLVSARRAASLARRWASVHEERKNKGAYASLAEASVLVAEDRTQLLKNKIEEAMAAYQTSPSIEEGKQEVALLAIQVGRLEAAEKVADMVIRTSMKIDLLQKIGEVFIKNRNAVGAARIQKRVAELDAAARMGWVAKMPSQEQAITAWIAAADRFNKNELLYDLQKKLAITKGMEEGVQETLPKFAQAVGKAFLMEMTVKSFSGNGKEFMMELTRIRATAARLEKPSN